MTALIKTCNKFSKFVSNTEQRRDVCVHTDARAHSNMHKYSDEKFTYTRRHSYTQKFIYSIKCLMFCSIKFEKRKLFKGVVKLNDQSILQSKITFEISLVTTKKDYILQNF